MMFATHLHTRLVEAGRACANARSSRGIATKRHNEALRELDRVIWHVMKHAPHMFSDAAFAEALVRQREAQ